MEEFQAYPGRDESCGGERHLSLGVVSGLLIGFQKDGTTWRIIPVSKWLITMVSKSPKWGYSPYKWPKWLINGGY